MRDLTGGANEAGESPVKRLKLDIQDESNRKSATLDGNSLSNIDLAHSNQDITQNHEIDTNQKLTPGGLKKNFHGVMYQLGLLTLASSRSLRDGKQFDLISEAEEFKKFEC